MILHSKKLFIGLFILIAYMSIGIFGLFRMDHLASVPMVDCPYAQNGSSMCRDSFDHINNWRQFSNLILTSLFIFSFILLGVIWHFFNQRDFLNQKQYFYKWRHRFNNKNLHAYWQAITSWLSLFENSPSLSYKA